MSQSSTTGFLQKAAFFWYYLILLAHNVTTLAITFTPVTLAEEDTEARAEGAKLGLGRRVGAVFFLTAPLN